MVIRGYYLVVFFSCVVLHESAAQTVIPDFSFPAEICTGEAFTITNNTTGGSAFKWNFCAKDLNQVPDGQNLGSFGGLLDQPTYIDIAFTNNNYYAFVTNFSSGNLIRLDFGNSLLNAPTAVNLGNINGVLPSGGNGGIQVVQNEGKWYAIIVAGYPPGGIDPRIMKVEFGSDITNLNPVGTDWGFGGNMYDPNDFVLIQEGNMWIGITVNGETNTITRFNFSNSFDNPPVVSNLGNIGNLGEPAGLYTTYENGDLIVFITNSGDKTRIGGMFNITRLNFGSSLLNNPSAVNIGNVGNMLQHPRDMTIVPFCNETLGFILNAHPFYNSLLKLNFNNDLFSFPSANDLGNPDDFDYPYSITDFYKIGNDLVALVVNKENSTITRLVFADCTNSSLPGSTSKDPPAISYNQAGIYNVQLIVDEGLSSETSLCKQVVVSSCVDTLIITNDTTICSGTSLQIKTHPAFSYQWTPSNFLDNATAASPVTTTTQNIKYYLDALITGDNLVTNGDFSNGNNDFLSGYLYTPTNVTEGEYFVGNDPKTWNISLDYCNDHSSGTGQMLLVNGSPAAGKQVWSQTVNIKPNTDYAFTAWLQALWSPNPASLQFYINGIASGNAFTASIPPCNWSQFVTTWNSGANSSVTLSIVDVNTADVGNDFAIDDISFAELIPVKDSISIKVKKAYIKANEDTTICAGQPVQLLVAQGSSFTWSPSAGLSDNSIPNPVATPTTTTEYIVAGIDTGGCLAKDTVLINVKPAPAVAITNDTLICKGATVHLSSSGGGTYEWTPATSLNDPAIPDPVTNTLSDITYKVKVTGTNACSTDDSVKVSVRQNPAFSATAPQSVCAGTEITLSASGGDTYQWTPASLIPDPSLPSNTFIPAASGVYQVNISESVCNYDTLITLNVDVHPLPVIAVLKSNDINCTVPVASLEASGAKSYSWMPAEGLDDASKAKPTATPDTTTLYTVTGINEFGCTSAASVTVAVEKSGLPRFVVPNAFSPNSDGKNDCFGIQRWGNAQVKQFSIYNRWGTIVFQATDPSQCWDGTWKGMPQNAGGYIYIIRATTLCGEVTRKGMLMLIR